MKRSTNKQASQRQAAPKAKSEVRERRRRYTDRDRAKALAALDANHGNLLKTATELTVPIATLSDWRNGAINDDVSEFRNEEKLNLADLFESVIIAGLQAKLNNAEKLSGLDIAIFTDKMHVCRGMPDSISKSLSADPEARRARILELVKQAA